MSKKKYRVTWREYDRPYQFYVWRNIYFYTLEEAMVHYKWRWKTLKNKAALKTLEVQKLKSVPTWRSL